ncbi:MAG: MFS transporter [Devosiaceae bacterium]|nr:MFS transporter [Devosiaceae bacterium MH13]
MRGITASGAVQATPCETVECSQQQRRYVLIVAILGSALGFIDGSIVAIIAPAIRVELDASLAAISWVVNGYTLVLTAFILIGGAAGDAYGKRRVFALGIALFAAASLVCAVAQSGGQLIGARLVQGFGAALMVPLSMALIAAYFPSDERGRAIGIWAAASAISAALGPLIGGAMVDALGWRSTFFVNLPLAAVTLWLLLARVPDDGGTTASHKLDWTGGLLASAALGLVALSLTLLGDSGALGPSLVVGTGGALGLMALGLAAGAAFIAYEGRIAAPMMPLSLFSLPSFAAINAATFLLYAALGGLLFFLPVTLIAAFEQPAVSVAAIFLPFTVVMALLTPRVGTLIDRVGVRWPLAAGALIAGLSFAATLLAVPTGSLIWVGACMALLGVGMGLCIPPLSTAILNAAPSEQSGIASGINNAVSRAGGLFAVAAFAPLAAQRYGSGEGGVPGFGITVDASATSAERVAHIAASVDAYSLLALFAVILAVASAALVLVLIHPHKGQPEGAARSA